jgi:hypothetical protein
MDLKEQDMSLDWIRLAQDRGQWLAVVNTVRDLRISYISLPVEPLLVSQERLLHIGGYLMRRDSGEMCLSL